MPLFLEWLTFGAALVLLELLIPGTYLIWFGFSALTMGGIIYFGGSFELMYQLLGFAVLSVVYALIGWRVYGRLIFQTNTPLAYRNLNNAVGQYVDKVVKVTEVKDDKIQVSVGDTVWPAVSQDTLKKGDKVVITGSDNGVILNVKKLVDKK